MTSLRNFTIAVAAIISPFWLDILKDVSQVAAALLPFFGIALAILQIVKLRKDKGE
jgi:tellurite resistance protein TehA-like permease